MKRMIWLALINRMTVSSFRQDVVDLAGGHGGRSGEDVSQVIEGIDCAAAAAREDGVDDGASPACVWMAEELPAAATYGCGPDRVLDKILVDFKAAVPQVAHQRGVFVEKVTDGAAER
jgi:hypothetical protein